MTESLRIPPVMQVQSCTAGPWGMANVVDVTTIQDEKKRLLAERINILAGKEYIMNQGAFRTGADYVAAVLRAKEAAQKTL